MLFCKEVHENLRGGNGDVTTYTTHIRRFIFFGRPKGKFIVLVLGPGTSVGMHQHTTTSEVYCSLNPNIRYADNTKWRFRNKCAIGEWHSAKNIGKRKALIFAYKK